MPLLTFRTCIKDSTTIDLRDAISGDGGYLDETSGHVEFLNPEEILICGGFHEFTDADMLQLAQTGTDPYTDKVIFNKTLRDDWYDKNSGFLAVDNNYNNDAMKNKIIVSDNDIYCKNFYEADEYIPAEEEWNYPAKDSAEMNKLRSFTPKIAYNATDGVFQIENIADLLNLGFEAKQLAVFLVHKRTRVPRGNKLQRASTLGRGTKNSVMQEIFTNVYHNNASDSVEPGSIRSFAIIEDGRRRSADGLTGYVIDGVHGIIGKNGADGINDFYKSVTTDIYERYYKNTKSGLVDRYNLNDDGGGISCWLHIPMQVYGIVVGIRRYAKRVKWDSTKQMATMTKVPLNETQFKKSLYDNKSNDCTMIRMCSYASSDAIVVLRKDDEDSNLQMEVQLRKSETWTYPYYPLLTDYPSYAEPYVGRN